MDIFMPRALLGVRFPGKLTARAVDYLSTSGR